MNWAIHLRCFADPVEVDLQARHSDVDLGHAQGLKLFEGACASCHQWNGKKQQTLYAPVLDTCGMHDSAFRANTCRCRKSGVD